MPPLVNEIMQREMLISVDAGPPATTTPLRKGEPDSTPNVQSSMWIWLDTPVHTMPCEPATVEAN